MPSVVVPAHNEEALIGDCLASILADGIPDLEVIVVPNACADRTAEIARGFGPPVVVIETDTPGKTNALNLAERHATRFPRAFVDGDIVLRPGALRAVFDTIRDPVHIASPPPEFDVARSDAGVRLFYRSLVANRYFGQGAPNGSGVFAVSEAGRARWGEFPHIIADDGFVELHFEPHEAATADGPPAVVQAPRTFRALLDIKTRARLGRHELRHKHPELFARARPSPGGTLTRMLARPSLWPAIPVYGYVRLVERRRAAERAKTAGYAGWLRDDTSRQADPPRSGA